MDGRRSPSDRGSFPQEHALVAHGGGTEKWPIRTAEVHMSNRNHAAIFRAGLAAALLLGCHPTARVSGQVFVTVQAGNSVKLGGVEVLAFSSSDLEAALERARSAWALKKARIAREAQVAEAEIIQVTMQQATKSAELQRIEASLQLGISGRDDGRLAITPPPEPSEARETTSDEVSSRSEERFDTVPGMAIRVGDSVDSHASELGPPDEVVSKGGGNVSVQIWHRSGRDIAAIHGRILGIGESAAAQSERARKTETVRKSTEERRAVQRMAQEAQRQAAHRTQATMVDSLVEERDALRKEVESLQAHLSEARQREAESLSAGRLGPQADFYFDLLPPPVAKAMTDADGGFAMEVAGRGRFAVAAHAKRELFKTTEELFWLVWVSPGAAKKPIYLTNHNLVTADSPDSAIKVVTGQED